MFCALNGATAMPRRASARHNPVTTSDFPASEDVPAIRTPLDSPAHRCPPAQCTACPHDDRRLLEPVQLCLACTGRYQIVTVRGTSCATKAT